MSTGDDGWSLVQRRTHSRNPSDNLASSDGSSTAVTQEPDPPVSVFKSSADPATKELFTKIEYISFRRPFAQLHSPAYYTPSGYTFYISGETTSRVYKSYPSIPSKEILPYLKENAGIQLDFMRYYKAGKLKRFERMTQSQPMDGLPDVPPHLQETEEKMDFRFFCADDFQKRRSSCGSDLTSMERRFTYQWKERTVTQEGQSEYKQKNSFFEHRAVTNKTMAVSLPFGSIRYMEFKDFSTDNQLVYGIRAGKAGEIIQYTQDQALFFTADTTYEQLLDVLGAREDLH